MIDIHSFIARGVALNAPLQQIDTITVEEIAEAKGQTVEEIKANPVEHNLLRQINDDEYALYNRNPEAV